MSGPDRLPCDAGVLLAGEEAPYCRRPQLARRGVLAATVLGSSLAFLDGSMVNVALPAIQTAFAADVSDVQWVLNAYVVMLGALMLAGGSAGDRFGRRDTFLAGLAVFAAASLGAGLAPSLPWLLAARAAQGIGGALLVPNSLALLSASFPREERGRAIGSWAAATAVTAALGSPLGGVLVDTLSWRPVFFLTPPLALLAAGLALRCVPGDGGDGEGRLDWLGAALVTGGLAGVAYGLIEGGSRGWGEPRIAAALTGGAVLLTAFAVTERRVARHRDAARAGTAGGGTTAPLVPPSVFRSGAFRAANLLTLFLYFALGGAFFVLPFHLIQVQGWSATATGAAFLPFTILVGGLSRWSGALFDRFGARLPLVLGPVIAATGYGLLAVPGTGAGYWSGFFPAMVVLGLGMAVSVAPLTTVVMAAVPERLAGTASGVNNATSRLANMLAVAVFGTVALGLFAGALPERLEAAEVGPEVRARVTAESARLAGLKAQLDRLQGEGGLAPAARQRVEDAVDDAFVATFRRLMLLAALLALLAAATAAVGLRGPGPEPDGADRGPG